MKNYREQITQCLADRALPPAKSFGGGRNTAAVLVGIMDAASPNQEPQVLLTRRADHLSSHAGQISFPGGYWEEGDENLIATALREAEEEVGLNPALVEVSGILDSHSTGYNQSIVPVVGFVKSDARLKASADEVAEIFSVPLSFLMTLENYEERKREWNGRVFTYHAIFWEGREIWGATASILRSLHDLVFARVHSD